MSKRTINYELLGRVKDKLKRMRHPEHFDMYSWAAKGRCGTTACIAGWTVMLAGKKTLAKLIEINEADNFNNDTVKAAISTLAADVLGLNRWQVARLFGVFGWPRKFQDRYRNADTAAERRDIAVERIQQFIDSEGKQ